MRGVVLASTVLMLTVGVIEMGHAGSVLTDDDIRAGRTPGIGDTVILSDPVSRCFPRSAVRTESVKGKWWQRAYRTQSGETGTMLCVEKRDMDDPQSCIVPDLQWHLNLEGTYDIWVGTYRPVYGGGLDIRLSDHEVYSTIDPWQTGLGQWPPPDEQIHRIVECFWRTDDLTGQDVFIRQPHGTYQSFWWGLCEAHLAYLRLVRRDPAAVACERAEGARLRTKGVIINRDGFSWIWRWGTEDLDCILQQVQNMQYGNVDALDFCIGGLAEANFNHPMTSGRRGIPPGPRLGGKRAARVFRYFYENDIDMLQILTQRCHELGIKIYASNRLNAHYGPSEVWRDHPAWRLESGGAWDFALPEMRQFYRDFLLYVAENYEIDGLTLDYSRGKRRHFNPDEERPLQHMNAFIRDLRRGLDDIERETGRELALNVSFVCHTRYEAASPLEQGLDVQTWVDEGIVDLIMPHGRDAMAYVQMCRDTDTRVCLRTSRGLDFAGQALGAHHHDPTAEEDKQDRPPIQRWFPLDYIEELLGWYDAGADGVFQFNISDAWVTYRHLPYPELLRQEVASGQPYGMIDGEHIEWLE